MFLALLVIFPALLFFKKEISFLLFASSDYSHFIFPINLLLVGTIGHLLCYSYFRGRLLMLKANILQIINIAILPLAVFGFAKDAVNVLMLLGGARCLISLVFLYIIFRQLTFLDFQKGYRFVFKRIIALQYSSCSGRLWLGCTPFTCCFLHCALLRCNRSR